MSVEKNMNTRIQHKHDTEANWNKAINFIPKIGEIIVYDIDENYNYSRLKIGDGVRTINNLEFSQTDSDILDANGILKNSVLPEGYPYKDVGEILPEMIVQIDPEVGQGIILDEFELHIGNSYIINYNGTEYSCEAKSFILENVEFIALGNIGVMDESGEAELTDEPFLLLNAPNNLTPSLGWYGGIIPLDGPEEVALSIRGTVIKKISKDFLPNINGINNLVDGSKFGSVRSIAASNIIGEYAHAEGRYTTASGDHSHAEGYSQSNAFDFIAEESTQEEIIAAHTHNYFTLANGNSSHAEGYATLALNTGSHAEGSYTIASGGESHAEGCYTIASGDYSHVEGFDSTASGGESHAEGYKTTASGDYSHAEGYCATASGDTSHAEGGSTIASGDRSHAEGYETEASSDASHAEGSYTIASGKNSHAEGCHTTASGDRSHAEGYETEALGNYSHAEGYNTTASGGESHAEGQYTIASGYASHAEGGGTIASCDYQHVQGKYNIEDTGNQYAHIVGNGLPGDAHSNAHTLDWDGNAWYAGDVYVGSTSGTNRDKGSKKLATEEFVNTQIQAYIDEAILGGAW